MVLFVAFKYKKYKASIIEANTNLIQVESSSISQVIFTVNSERKRTDSISSYTSALYNSSAVIQFKLPTYEEYSSKNHKKIGN